MAISTHALAQSKPDFTPEEQQWIRDHPVVRFSGARRFPPLEMVVDGRYEGVIADYLKAIARQSGLQFRYTPVKDWPDAQRAVLEGRTDLMPNTTTWHVSDALRSQLSLTEPYFFSPTVIVTRSNGQITSSLDGFGGKTIAVQRDSSYAAILEDKYPAIHVLLTESMQASFEAVVDGRAAAAVGPATTFVPLLRRQYVGLLGVSGALDGMPLTLEMGVRRDNTLLYSIIRKSLSSLTAEQTDQIEEHSLDQMDYGAPSLMSIAKYRALELAVLGVFVVLLVLFAYRARVAHRRAEQSELAKSRFLAVMSHEIRTPMNAVIASVEMLRRTPLDARQDNLTATASTAAEALLGLLDDVLDLSKLDAKRLQLERIPTDIGALTGKIIDIVRDGAQGKGLAVEVHLDTPPDLDALLDPTRFRQVLLNLLTNALKFTERGSITVKVEAPKDTAAGSTSIVTVQVIDTGIGIPAAQQAGLFQAYTQADSSTTRRFGGTGLGLTICKELVELMGGHITLDSTVDAGTRIQFTLPVEWVDRLEGATPALESTVPAASTNVAPMADAGLTADVRPILFVEDHTINQFVIGEQLKELGVAVVTVSDGHAALRALDEQPFALVLMDCHMPGMDGYETSRRIREREAAQGSDHLPIIAVSAATDAAHQEQCMRSGMDGVLQKPLRMEALRGTLEMWIGPLRPALSPLPSSGNPAPGPSVSHQEALQEDVAGMAQMLDPDAVKRLVHRLKGAAYVAGYDSVGQLAEQLETLVKVDGTGFYAEALFLLEQIRDEVAKLDTSGPGPTLKEPSGSR